MTAVQLVQLETGESLGEFQEKKTLMEFLNVFAYLEISLTYDTYDEIGREKLRIPTQGY